jgi:hypothetical protein
MPYHLATPAWRDSDFTLPGDYGQVGLSQNRNTVSLNPAGPIFGSHDVRGQRQIIPSTGAVALILPYLLSSQANRSDRKL